MNDGPASVGSFFNSLTSQYTEAIERCFPRYREMLATLLEYLPDRSSEHGRPVRRILELGCGTGNLSVLLRAAYPHAELHVVDVSADSLDVCRDRLRSLTGQGVPDPTLHCRDMRELQFETDSFDLIASSIAIHHLTSDEKQLLFRSVRQWLAPAGVFAFADQCRGVTEDLYQRHIADWRRMSMEAGAAPEEFEMWMEHQRDHDHHDTLPDQLQWLEEAGFPIIDCVWRCLLWSVVQARC